MSDGRNLTGACGGALRQVTYTGLMHACAEGLQLDKAMALFTYMEVAGVERNQVTYSVAINACSRNGQWELGLQLLHEMARKGIPPDVQVRPWQAACMAQAPGRALAHSYAARRMRSCIASKCRRCDARANAQTTDVAARHRAQVFNSAISACEKGKAYEMALRLVAQMRQMGCQPNAVTYGAAIAACAKAAQWTTALALLQQVRPKNSPPSADYSPGPTITVHGGSCGGCLGGTGEAELGGNRGGWWTGTLADCIQLGAARVSPSHPRDVASRRNPLGRPRTRNRPESIRAPDAYATRVPPDAYATRVPPARAPTTRVHNCHGR